MKYFLTGKGGVEKHLWLCNGCWSSLVLSLLSIFHLRMLKKNI